MMNYSIRFNSRRSNTIGQNGMVATSQPLAAQAGLEILRAGGNAVDAAIATAATLCVVEPGMTGLGGDAFALIWSAKEQRLYGLNASGPAPAALTAVSLRNQGHTTFPRQGGLSVTVPGALRGWELALNRFGSLLLPRLLQSAITYAEKGFPVSESVASDWAMATELLSQHEVSKRVWLPGGRSPQVGTLFHNPEFAATLRKIGDEGADAFYTGDIAQQIADCVQADGGLLTIDDLKSYQAEWVEPISIEYRPGVRVYELPPNGQGLTALLALNLLKGFDVANMGHGSYELTHTMMETIKLAFADAQTYIADPKRATIPLAGLLSDSYAAERRRLIESKTAVLPIPGQPQQHGDTIYLTVADAEGNMVSWIQSLCSLFGSGLTAGTTGVQLQNRACNFSLEAGHPNEAAGGKRPYHTIIPAFIMRDNQPWASFGVVGGFMQPQGHLQVMSNLVDFGMTPQAALDAPRFRWQQGKLFGLEAAFGDSMAAELRRRGHQIMPWAEAAGLYFGGGQVIVRDLETAVYIGGSEKRNDGVAVGF
ncbi:MAG: gamma-glutamyltransferase [Chloroflexota bacterium]